MGTTMIRWPFLTASTDISVSISNPVSFRFICWMASFVKDRYPERDIVEIAAVGELEEKVEHVVAKEVDPGERALFGIDQPVADYLVESQKERGEHLLRVFAGVRPVAIDHQDVGLLDHLECLDNGIPLPPCRSGVLTVAPASRAFFTVLSVLFPSTTRIWVYPRSRNSFYHGPDGKALV